MFTFLGKYSAKKIQIGIFCLAIFIDLSSQSLDNLKNQEPLTVNGFISTNQIVNIQPSDSGKIVQYNSYYTGSLALSLYGVNTPFTFMYSNNRGNFTHPFNQFGLHPSYKWIKSHIGYSSMSFSPYTLNGHLFLGAGIEVDPPGIFYGSAMYGRLKNAVEYDSSNANQIVAYKRMGYGFKIGVMKNGNFVDVSFFRAKDILNSINNTGSENPVMPEENSVMSLSFNQQITKNLIFQGEIANSLLTTDIRTEMITEKNILLKPQAWFMSERTSTINRKALKTNITYKQDRYSIGLGFEHIDPEYRTLGAYYFTNNMENLTLNFSANFFENKISAGGNAGFQKDNVDKSRMNSTNRFVGSGNLNFMPGENLNLNLAYSNFTSFTNIQSTFDYINETDPYQNFDTLNFRQISQNTNFNGSYQFNNSKEKLQTVNVNLTWQVSNNKLGVDSLSRSNFYNSSASYIINFKPIALTCNASIYFNLNEVTESGSYTIGPVVGLSKLFFENSLRTSLTISYSSTKTKGFSPGNIFNSRLGVSYLIKKKHNFNLNMLFQQRENNRRSFNTLNITFGYTYNFNLLNNENRNKKEI